MINILDRYGPLDSSYESLTLDDLPITPFIHQRTAALAMMRVENCISNNSLFGRLKDSPGSGKTFITLMLILANKELSNRPVYHRVSTYSKNSLNVIKTNDLILCKRFKNIISPTIIFVALPIVNQWLDDIKKFPTLNVLLVNNLIALRIFEKKLVSGEINSYDIILVKSGNISGEFKIRDDILEKRNTKRTRKIYNVIANLTRSQCFNRVILDDCFDIDMDRPAPLINALFTWAVSATDKEYKKKSIESHTNRLEFTDYDIAHFSDIFTIECSPQFIAESIHRPSIRHITYKVHNPNELQSKCLRHILGTSASEVMNMIEHDAISSAAKTLGMSTDNISVIFKKVLRDKYDEFNNLTSMIKWATAQLSIDFDSLPHISKLFNKTDCLNMKKIEFKYTNIIEILTEFKDQKVSELDKVDSAINRVKESIKDGVCPLCFEELNDIPGCTILLPCCGKVLCAVCCPPAMKLHRIGKDIKGRCPYCRTDSSFSDLIIIGEDFDLSSINTELPEMKEFKNEYKKTKNDTLVEILNSEGDRKYIIFSKYGERIEVISETLRTAGIYHARLYGSVARINRLVKEFNSGSLNVLLLNSEKNATGMNLQIATDIILMHEITEAGVYEQVIGRIDRIGRVNQATVHHIEYI